MRNFDRSPTCEHFLGTSINISKPRFQTLSLLDLSILNFQTFELNTWSTVHLIINLAGTHNLWKQLKTQQLCLFCRRKVKQLGHVIGAMPSRMRGLRSKTCRIKPVWWGMVNEVSRNGNWACCASANALCKVWRRKLSCEPSFGHLCVIAASCIAQAWCDLPDSGELHNSCRNMSELLAVDQLKTS